MAVCQRSMKSSMELHTILLFCSSLFSISILSTATDTITMSQSIRDGQAIVSAGGSFELGFFSPANSTKRYLGIWYKKISTGTVAWVANREVPIHDSSGVLKLTNEGILVLLNQNETGIWSSNSSRPAVNPVAQLLDSGNLVVRDANDDNPENFLWQSFDYLGDTLLPGMKLGWNKITGLERYLSSWKSADDPSPGNFTYRLDPRGYPQLVIRKDSVQRYRLGPWNGHQFSGTSKLTRNPIFYFHLVINQKEMYYTYELANSSVVTRAVLNQNGILQRSIWVDRTQSWNPYRNLPADTCDSYAICGGYNICDTAKSPMCGCLKGYVPKSPVEWDMADWSSGCVRRTPLDCQKGDGFIKYSGFKMPDTRYSWFNARMTLEECKLVCLKNCSCMAYANLNISAGGSGCLLWFGDLIDIKEYSEERQAIYIRMASSEVGGSNRKKRSWIILSSVFLGGMVLLGLGLTLFFRKKKNQPSKEENKPRPERCYTAEELDLPLFDLATIANATNDFSNNNKLGEGGFGPVYKGVLEDGQEIAVKRLSKNSRQGLNEFKNEVVHIAKLQHRNLVKLLGCCIQVNEMMLIYEFMSNKSLDFFIFDHSQSKLLDWPRRFQIINGIAQGLLYLHRDSRLRIIHRDLKASNILLDHEMNPKISDFGLSRSFGGNEIEANTNKVVGTYGYMSPEYAIDGLYSIKSDVFSFGVLLLEIVSGKRNRCFYHPDHHLNLIGHAWRLYIEGRPMELVDALIGDSDARNLFDVLRSIHVGLLCVQQCPEDRPSMSSVVLMLGGEGVLPQPKQPGFFIERKLVEAYLSSGKHELCSSNGLSISLLEAR